jgi:hypothetical protein
VENSLHVISAFEEIRMKGRARYVVIAVLLTIFDGITTVYCCVSNWKALPGDVWGWGCWTLVAALGANSLVNVWSQAIQDSGVSFFGRNAGCTENATLVSAEARGQGDV